MRKLVPVLVAALVAVGLVGSSPAQAQNDLINNVPDLTTPGVNASLLSLNRPAGSSSSSSSKKPRRAPRATAAQLRKLRFTPRAARTRAL